MKTRGALSSRSCSLTACGSTPAGGSSDDAPSTAPNGRCAQCGVRGSLEPPSSSRGEASPPHLGCSTADLVEASARRAEGDAGAVSGGGVRRAVTVEQETPPPATSATAVESGATSHGVALRSRTSTHAPATSRAVVSSAWPLRCFERRGAPSREVARGTSSRDRGRGSAPRRRSTSRRSSPRRPNARPSPGARRRRARVERARTTSRCARRLGELLRADP
jgi:hypothetical protein